MNKRVKVLPLLLAVLMSICAFAFTACTDKEKPRELDAVEKSIVGNWVQSDVVYTFGDDGKFAALEWKNDVVGQEWKHDGEGSDYPRGHYNVIQIGEYSRYALFDNEPNKLYYIDDNLGVTEHAYYERQ